MANKVIITRTLPGEYKNLFHIFLESDGASGELSNEVLVDPVADLGLGSETRMAIQSIRYNFSGFSGSISFDSGLVDKTLLWRLADNSDNFIDFQTDYGGLTDSSGLDGTGKILLSTNGFDTAANQGSIILWIRNS